MAALISTGFILFDMFIVLLTGVLALFVYFKHSYQYWKNKGVPYLEPKFPYGNNRYLLSKTPSFDGEVKHWYDELKAKGCKFGGVWALSRKALVLVDPDYIRDVLTQDFNYFVDRDIYCNEKSDPLGTHLFNIPNPNWKPLRQKLTPTFTSGKMKMMFKTILECSNYMVDYLQRFAMNGSDIDIREVLASFTTDVIGSVAFGVECNSFDKSRAEFREQGIRMFKGDWTKYLKIAAIKYFPDLSKFIGIKGGRESTRKFFLNVINQTINFRNSKNESRNDFLQILIDINNSGKESEKFTIEQIVANSILFFIAGFDTSSTAMTFSLYELARNPDIQTRARQEIRKVLERHDGQITYESVQEMTYLKQVLDEAMRMYPPLLVLARVCTKDYTLRDTEIIIEKGTPVVISTLALGRDSDYFPDPEKFDPDRFTQEAKAQRHPYVHLPFGEGPRNCIGLRFGVMQSKIGLIRILKEFELSISPKTKMPLTLDLSVLLTKSNERLYLLAKKI